MLDFQSRRWRPMTNQASELQLEDLSYRWSNRILVLALAGILFLTLYPFRFSFHAHLSGNRSPFFLINGMKSSGLFAAFLNVLLFVPFGFGLSLKLRERENSGVKVLLLIMAAGALLSYCIEFLQIFIPTRDSGWEDVFTNTTGSVVGYFFLVLFGGVALSLMSSVERGLDRFLTTYRALWIISLYFAIWFALSVPLQEQSRLSNWIQDCRILIGNGAATHPERVWKGEVSLLQFWDRPLSAAEIGAQKLSAATESSAVATYVFSGSSPLEDKKRFLPDLRWIPSAPDTPDVNPLVLTGKSWMISSASVANLVKAFQKARSFSVRLVCTPGEVEGPDKRILSISEENGPTNLSLRQHDGNLVVWFRNPLSARRDELPLAIPDAFVLNQPRDIFVSYDGSKLSVYLDSKRDPRVYELTPGVPLAQLIRHVKTAELEGYTYIYYALVFVPLGVLLGIVVRPVSPWNVMNVLVLAIAFVLPSVCLELLLVRVSGRGVLLGNVLLSVLFALGAALWINSDRQQQAGSAATDHGHF